MGVKFSLDMEDHGGPRPVNFLGFRVGQGQTEEDRGRQKFLDKAFQSLKITAKLPAQFRLGALVQNQEQPVAGMVTSLFGLIFILPQRQVMAMLPGVFESFWVSFGKAANFQIKRQTAQIEINTMMLLICFRLYIGMGQKHLQNLIVSVVVIPAADGISSKRLNWQLGGFGYRLSLALHACQGLHPVNEIAQPVPLVTLRPTPRGQHFEFVEFVADQVKRFTFHVLV